MKPRDFKSSHDLTFTCKSIYESWIKHYTLYGSYKNLYSYLTCIVSWIMIKGLHTEINKTTKNRKPLKFTCFLHNIRIHRNFTYRSNTLKFNYCLRICFVIYMIKNFSHDGQLFCTRTLNYIMTAYRLRTYCTIVIIYCNWVFTRWQ
jgi:hypothetical protein